MVAFTPTQNYPYAQPTDPADVPERLQAFAERVDENQVGWRRLAAPRYMAQFFGNVPNIIPGTGTNGTLTWQLTDFNTLRFLSPDPGIEPLTSTNTTDLTATFTGAGHWFVTCSVQIATSPATIDMMGIELLVNGAVASSSTASLTHDTVFAADGTHTVDISTGVSLSGGDRVSIRGRVGRASGTAPAQFLNRSITLLRMRDL